VIFSDLTKFDGDAVRRLTEAEIRQIAGRAGRFGHHEIGFAGVFTHENPKTVAAALAASDKPPDDLRPYVMAPYAAIREIAVRLDTIRLTHILAYFATTVLADDEALRPANMASAFAVARAVDHSRLDLATKSAYLGAPIETRTGRHEALLANWAIQHGQGRAIPPPTFATTATPDSDNGLQALEEAAKELTLYLWLALRWPAIYAWHTVADQRRRACNGLIENALRSKALHRSCKRCGKKLGFAHKFAVCDACFKPGRNGPYHDFDN
jgi:ATP-dependent RNA helicase SUPV3L1/SUV3